LSVIVPGCQKLQMTAN